MLRRRYLFPAVYLAFLLPFALGVPVAAKLAVLVACPSLALAINSRAIARIAILLLTALCTFVPLLLLVKGSLCSSLPRGAAETLFSCVAQRSVAVLLNVCLLSSVFLLATANEWRGSLVATMNNMCVPRSVRMMAIVSGSLIGEFRRAMNRVYQAFTA